jgi:hypothetical protein
MKPYLHISLHDESLPLLVSEQEQLLRPFLKESFHAPVDTS